MKSQFFGYLDARNIEGKWWRLLQPLGYYSEQFDVTVCGPTDFVLDFSSVPRLPIAYWLVGGTGKWESVPHDVGYRFGFLPQYWLDCMYYESGMVRSSMRQKQTKLLKTGRWIRTSGMTAFVKAFGWTAYHPIPGCLDYREKDTCGKECSNCVNYYSKWELCKLDGYRPDILDMHRRV